MKVRPTQSQSYQVLILEEQALLIVLSASSF